MADHPGAAVERKGEKACMRAGFLTAEASLQSDSTTMQAKRPQAVRMLLARLLSPFLVADLFGIAAVIARDYALCVRRLRGRI
jgi:hypothetical protein